MRIRDWSSDVCSSDLSVDQVHARSLAYHLQDVVACDGRGVGEAFRLGLRAAWYPDATARDCSRAAEMLAFFKDKHLQASLGCANRSRQATRSLSDHDNIPLHLQLLVLTMARRPPCGN